MKPKKIREIKITTNKNMIPGYTLRTNKPSGFRIGFAACPTKECANEEAKEIAHLIFDYLRGIIAKEGEIKKEHLSSLLNGKNRANLKNNITNK